MAANTPNSPSGVLHRRLSHHRRTERAPRGRDRNLAQAFGTLLGRSALEWVIDQYQVSTDPNRPDDPEYILHLIGQVITVSLETVQIVKSLPEFVIADSTGS
jgi:hypothetical protein